MLTVRLQLQQRANPSPPACRFGSDGNTVVELGVHDSGKGIPEADLGRIFEPFFTTKVERLGMGLAISHAIVEAHGGRLLAENDPAGGAIFRVHLRTDGDRHHPGA